MLVFPTILFLLTCFHTEAGYIESVIVSGCASCRLQLSCRHFSSIIVIIEADFIRDEILVNNTITASTAFPPVHPIQALNQRCSGITYCTFILWEDCPGATEWGPGILTVKYACVSEDRVQSFCNSEITLPSDPNAAGSAEGLIHSPGYPRFYAIDGECRWTITATYHEQILITLLDISLIANNAISEDDCTDHLAIIDAGQTIYTTCRSRQPPVQIVTSSGSIQVVLKATHFLTPLRGVLFYYGGVGCPTPTAPLDGYLVQRNATVALFRCCVGFEFPSGERNLRVHCLGNAWDAQLPLPDCQRTLLLSTSRNNRKLLQTDMASDLIAPALIIVALFLINFIVLFYIYKAKLKNTSESADEELGVLSRINKVQECSRL